jgi:hypothetical protein
MALRADTCPECRALVPDGQMAVHTAWHAGLTAMLARIQTNHPHGPVEAPRAGAGKK